MKMNKREIYKAYGIDMESGKARQARQAATHDRTGTRIHMSRHGLIASCVLRDLTPFCVFWPFCDFCAE